MRILFFPGPYGITHAARLLYLKHLLGSSHTYALHAFANQSRLDWDDITHFNAPNFPAINDPQADIYSIGDETLLKSTLQSELHAINQFKPDLIFFDLRLTARISAALMKIPTIAIANATLIETFNPFAFTGTANAEIMQEKYRIRTGKKMGRRFTKLAQSLGIRNLESIFDFTSGDVTLIADLPSAFPIEPLKEREFYFGPVIHETFDLQPFTFPFKTKAAILIYVTIGHTGGTAYLSHIIEAFKGDSYCQLIITTSHQQTGFELGFISDNIFLTTYLNGADILPLCDLVIHHGGNGTSYQAIKYNKPSIVIPNNTEQVLNARMIELTETGIVLDKRYLTPEKIRQTAQTIYKGKKFFLTKTMPISEAIQGMDQQKLLEAAISATQQFNR